MQHYAFLQRTPLSQQEAKVIYRQCYLPKVTYPLPATTMPPGAIYKTQAAVSTLFLNKMGYPCHTLPAVVYTPASVRGLDFHHLRYEQGIPTGPTTNKTYEGRLHQWQSLSKPDQCLPDPHRPLHSCFGRYQTYLIGLSRLANVHTTIPPHHEYTDTALQPLDPTSLMVQQLQSHGRYPPLSSWLTYEPLATSVSTYK